ncbi:MFS transporter [Streptomyces fimicarius]|uniref:MFS transporter n=1 Tax=Streptomyces griseus TaxID=1911 RepID=UPI0036C9EF5B
MTPSSSAPSSETGPAPDWRRIGSFVTGQAAVQCGSFALIIAMNWTAVQLGGRGAVTVVILASTLPRALMLLFGGALADALGPRAVLLRATATRLAVLAVGALVTAGADSIWPLIAVAVVEGSLLGLTGPASGILLTQLAPKEHLGRANSLFSMVMRLAPIAGSPLGAWLVVAGSLSGVMLVAAAGCAVWLLCAFHVTRGMARPEHGAGPGGISLFRRSGDGLALLGTHPKLRWMFIACFCMDFAFLWPAEVALPLRASGEGWGIGPVAAALTAFSVGALLSAAAGAALAHRIPVPVKLVVTGTGLAVCMGSMALAPSPAVLAVTACAAGVFSGLNGPALVTAYQQAVPEGKLGAAMSTFSLSSIGAAPLSLAVFSSLSAPLGVTGTWLLCACVALFSPIAATLSLRAPLTRNAPAPKASAAPEPTATAV